MADLRPILAAHIGGCRCWIVRVGQVTAKKSSGRSASTSAGSSGATKSAATKSTATKSTATKAPAKKTPAKKTPAKASAKKTPAKQAPARKTPAKKVTAKKAQAKKAPATKVTAKKAPAKASAKRAPAKKVTTKKATTKKVTAKASPTRKAPARKAAPSRPASKTTSPPRSPRASRPRRTSPAARRALVVRPDEEPWTKKELAEVRAELDDDVRRLRGELDLAEHDIDDMLRDAGDGAGDDPADAGSKTFEREHEMSLANNTRDMLTQSGRAIARIDNGTYGVCENCGNPIGKARLQVFPRATLCLICKQREERR
ncbi:MAG: histone H1-like repetitive region-containing protein [Propionibacteriales bacterium]|nr:histone H1-like repetitive region-containing protein [Propionibacteriales bacterium]